MGVNAITRTEKVRRDKLADAERDLFRKEGRCLKRREPIFMTREYPNNLAVAKKLAQEAITPEPVFSGITLADPLIP